MGKNKLLIFGILLFYILATASVAQEFNEQLSASTGGIDIQVLGKQIIGKNQEISISARAFNLSSGLLLTNESTSCELNLYNKSGFNLANSMMGYESLRFNYTISSSNFSETGIFPFVVYCNTSSIGGFHSGSFLVTNTGKEEVMLNIPLVTIIGLIVIFLFYISLVFLMRVEIFSQHGLMKALILLLIAWAILIPINLIILFNADNGSSANIISNLNIVYTTALWVNYFLSFYILLWVIISMLKKLYVKRINLKK